MSTQPTPPALRTAVEDPLATLRHHVGWLYLRAGKPSTREISRRTMRAISHTTVSAVLRCASVPKWGPLELTVEALNGDVEQFRQLWAAAEEARSVIGVDGGPGPDTAAEGTAEPPASDADKSDLSWRQPTGQTSNVLAVPSTSNSHLLASTKDDGTVRPPQTISSDPIRIDRLSAENAELRQQVLDLRAKVQSLNAGTDTSSPGNHFGYSNRMRLLEQFFSSRYPVTPGNAWRNIYRLLLWIDPTIGLAHCYESDKCQPGRPWYARSLAFHTWLAREFGVSPRDLGAELDVLFKWILLHHTGKHGNSRTNAEAPGQAYAPDEVPMPGEDRELIELINRHLEPWFREPPHDEDIRNLTASLRLRIGQEAKRKNLLGEGFEDTVGATLQRIPRIRHYYNIRVRPNLHDLPGFQPPKRYGRGRVLSLALVRKSNKHRTLVTCLWSIRRDRECQLVNEYMAYMSLRSNDNPFDNVLITNEFDPAAMASVCERMTDGRPLFNAVIHVNPAGLLAAHGTPNPKQNEGSIARAGKHIMEGRIQSLETWLAGLAPVEASALPE